MKGVNHSDKPTENCHQTLQFPSAFKLIVLIFLPANFVLINLISNHNRENKTKQTNKKHSDKAISHLPSRKQQANSKVIDYSFSSQIFEE